MNERKILAAARYQPLELGGRGSIDAHAANYSSSLDESKVKAGALHQTTDLRAPQSPAVLTDECHKRY
jgi:hypothetical protein